MTEGPRRAAALLSKWSGVRPSPSPWSGVSFDNSPRVASVAVLFVLYPAPTVNVGFNAGGPAA